MNGNEPGAKYSEAVRMFAFNINFLSPRTYIYIREKFNGPHPETIRKWFCNSNENCTGGFHDSAMTTLSEIVKELAAVGQTLYVALSFDEMGIRHHVQYLHHKKKFVGFINFGTQKDIQDPLPVAKNAIVIMVNAINIQLTLPIAFFFITTLISEEKAIMTATVLKALTNIGVKVASVTSDGLATNPASYEILGTSSDDINAIVPFFRNPDTDEKVFVFYDAPHMLKLVRNCIGDKSILRDKENRKIDWKYIERLYRMKKNDLVSHKLTKKHMNWESNKMNVLLAIQTISNSVALTIEKCAANGNPLFKGKQNVELFFVFQNYSLLQILIPLLTCFRVSVKPHLHLY